MSQKIMLKGVRLSFPSIFKRSSFDGKEGKFEATFLLPKSDVKTHSLIMDAIKEELTQNKIKVPVDKYFIKDGDFIEYDGYKDHWSIKASNNQRPLLIDGAKNPIVEEDNLLYGGCYVNAQIGIWIQNNAYGKRVNANVFGIQFVKAGESFSANNVSDLNDFDNTDNTDTNSF